MYKMLINAFGIDPEYGHAPECQRLKRQQHLLRNLLPPPRPSPTQQLNRFPPLCRHLFCCCALINDAIGD